MKLPVVRLDAVFVHAQDYDMALAKAAPGNGNRTVTFTDWNLPYFFDDPFNLGEGVFYYDNVKWQNPANKEDVNDHGTLTYDIEVKEAGTYEFVVLGCAQITEANLDVDAKDRGFCYSIDGGPMYQVNISDTLGVFRRRTIQAPSSGGKLKPQTSEFNVLPAGTITTLPSLLPESIN